MEKNFLLIADDATKKRNPIAFAIGFRFLWYQKISLYLDYIKTFDIKKVAFLM